MKVIILLVVAIAVASAKPCVDCGNTAGDHKNTVHGGVGDDVDSGNHGGDHANQVGGHGGHSDAAPPPPPPPPPPPAPAHVDDVGGVDHHNTDGTHANNVH